MARKMQPSITINSASAARHIIFTALLLSSLMTLAAARLKTDIESRANKQSEFTGVNSCHWREFDLCAVGTASLFQNPNGLPQTEVELNRQCEYLNESAQCFEDFATKCLTDQQWHLMEMFATSSQKILREFCKADSELRSNYTKHVQCFREIQRQYQRPCVTDFQVGFEYIHKQNLTRRLETACCNINRLKVCIFDPVEYECGLAAEDTIRQLIETVAGSLLSLPCRDYDPASDRCKDVLPKPGTKAHGTRNTSALSKIISGFVNVPAQV